MTRRTRGRRVCLCGIDAGAEESGVTGIALGLTRLQWFSASGCARWLGCRGKQNAEVFPVVDGLGFMRVQGSTSTVPEMWTRRFVETRKLVLTVLQCRGLCQGLWSGANTGGSEIQREIVSPPSAATYPAKATAKAHEHTFCHMSLEGAWAMPFWPLSSGWGWTDKQRP